jgi:queuosine precursor transporter
MSANFHIDKRIMLYIVLCSIFLSNALMAELIGVKIFSLEDSLSFEKANINILGFTLDFNLTAGVIIWPVVFITSDIINEYFGVNGVKKISYITAVIIGYTFFVIFIATQLPPADFWLNVNNTDNVGNPFNIDFAYRKLFGQGMGIIIGSITAFLVGQIVDAYTFQYLKKITNSKKLWIRATGSTLFSQLIDSFLVLYIAFFIFGNWPLEQVLAVGFVNYIYKFCVAIFLTPLLYAAHFIIDNYLAEKK